MLIGWIMLGILLVLLLLLVILLAMAFQVRASYNQGDAALWVKYGPLKLQLYPAKAPKKKKERKPKEEKKPTDSQEEKPKKKLSISGEQILYALETLPPILGRALQRTRRGIRVSPLKVHLLIAGDDPAGTALLYGQVQAALTVGMPVVRQTVHICGEDIQLFLDFQRTQPDCIAEVGLSIRCWTGVSIALRASGSLVKWFLGFRTLAPPSREKPAEKKQQQDSGAA